MTDDTITGYDARKQLPGEDWDTERHVLLVERDRLMREGTILQAESARLKDSRDRDTLRALATRLHRHVNDVRAYSGALHRFHERVGPLLSTENTVNHGNGWRNEA